MVRRRKAYYQPIYPDIIHSVKTIDNLSQETHISHSGDFGMLLKFPSTAAFRFNQTAKQCALCEENQNLLCLPISLQSTMLRSFWINILSTFIIYVLYNKQLNINVILPYVICRVVSGN